MAASVKTRTKVPLHNCLYLSSGYPKREIRDKNANGKKNSFSDVYANFIRVLAWAKKIVKNATKLSFFFSALRTCPRKFHH